MEDLFGGLDLGFKAQEPAPEVFEPVFEMPAEPVSAPAPEKPVEAPKKDELPSMEEMFSLEDILSEFGDF